MLVNHHMTYIQHILLFSHSLPASPDFSPSRHLSPPATKVPHTVVAVLVAAVAAAAAVDNPGSYSDKNSVVVVADMA